MNKIYFSTIFLLLAVTSIAQDLMPSMVYPQRDASLRSGVVNTFYVTLTANDEIPVGGKFKLLYIINDGTAETALDVQTLTNKWLADSTFEFALKVNVPVLNDTAEMTFIVQLENDTRNFNDTFKTRYYFQELVDNDIEITFNSPKNGSKYKIGDQIDFELSVENQGLTDLKKNQPIIYAVTLDDKYYIVEETVGVYTGNDITKGESSTISTTLKLGADFPIDMHKICFFYWWSELVNGNYVFAEGYSENNSDCVEIEVEKSNGINTTDLDGQFNVVVKNQSILLNLNKSIEQNFEISLFSLDGKMTMNKSVSSLSPGQYQFATPMLHTGLYIFQIRLNSGEYYNHKVVAP